MNDIYDIAIIGGGPAGLSAALTARIRGKKVALFEHLDFSRKLQRAHDVDNYLGMPHRTGTDIMREMADHALAHEPDVIREKVISVFPGKKNFTIACKEEMYTARTVILATGVTSGALFEGEKDLLGKGVSYCATCDGMFFRGKTVAVISYGKEGEADAAYLANLCKEVYYLPQYRDEMNLRADNIIVENVMPRRIEGEN
ncbi:MAG: FAD-dependent oxidoreductase, partial [Selenomonadales bacterium]|nr:FAD-dependent oxidoreductase [Selenomonadales bacterium]